MKKKQLKFIPPKQDKQDIVGMYVQIDGSLHRDLSKHICRKKGTTWRALIEFMIKNYLEDNKS